MTELAKVTFAAVKTSRSLRPGDDLSELAKSLKEDGQHKPITLIIDPYQPQKGLQLFDGLRRVEALKQLGFDEVSAAIVTSVEDLYDLITPVDESADFTYPLSRRWPDFVTQWSLLRPLGLWHLNLSRNNLTPGTGRWRRELFQRYGINATMFRDVKVMADVQETLTPGTDPLLEKIVSEFVEGKIGPSAARYRMSKYRLAGDVTKARDQIEILNGAVDTLRSVSAALKSLGPPAKELSTKDAQEWQKAFEEFSATLQVINKNLNRENKKS